MDIHLVAVGSFTCAKCVLHVEPQLIVSSERLAPTPPTLTVQWMWVKVSGTKEQFQLGLDLVLVVEGFNPIKDIKTI